MPLFDVPGWIVDLPPVPETSSTTSKKRKRPANDSCKVEAAEANLEKLVKKLKLPLSTDTSPNTRKGKNKANDDHPVSAKPKKRKHKKPEEVTEQGKQNLAPKLSGSAPVEKSQRGDKKHGSGTSPSNAATSGLTALQKGMKESLDGARFRMINESLYKSDSHHAHQMMKEDPHVFEDYHSGFRHQVQLWPTNPVDHYISVLTTYPKKTIIADLGCGDAAMAHALIPKGLNVLSFDLVSEGTFVVEADICSKIPLPGSAPSLDDKSEGQGHVVDVVVCALSLMGTNWPNCLREAWRILKPGGELKIAEVASRFTDIEGFQNLVGLIGFRLKSKDDTNSHFTLFEFRKVAVKGKSDAEWEKMLRRATLLKPCEYKRR